MSKPPMKAIEQIKNYCNKTQCRRCVYGIVDNDYDYVGCLLQQHNPCDWEINPQLSVPDMPCEREVPDGH